MGQGNVASVVTCFRPVVALIWTEEGSHPDTLGMSAGLSQISIVPGPDGVASPGSLYWWNGENGMYTSCALLRSRVIYRAKTQ